MTNINEVLDTISKAVIMLCIVILAMIVVFGWRMVELNMELEELNNNMMDIISDIHDLREMIKN